jgi:hypothetical protein
MDDRDSEPELFDGELWFALIILAAFAVLGIVTQSA